ncbi:MAG: hypothetical protein HFJ55_06760 [Clostridia bacterium]|nr:hypothetical protein [Clostridia bacterium]
MKKEKKSVEFSFATFLIILIIIVGIVYVVAKQTGYTKEEEVIVNESEKEEQEHKEENTEEKLFSKNVITIDEGKLNDKWQIVDQENGSIIFYIQGPKEENEDGTTNDIRINIYLQQSEMTNEDLKKQMLENSIYQKIEYTKMQEINGIQFMEFEAENKGVKAKILTKMIDGYMCAAEICGEEKIYEENYNMAMKAVMTIKVADRIDINVAQELIYKYDNLANIKEGGTQYLLTSLKLPQNLEQTEEDAQIPDEYKDYNWTRIKYEDFENEMKQYMTEEVLKNRFSEFVNYNGALLMKEVTGKQTEYMIEEVKPTFIKGNETTYEVAKQQMNTFITIRQNITLKLENGKCVVSNIE